MRYTALPRVSSYGSDAREQYTALHVSLTDMRRAAVEKNAKTI
jgi:hypothetical protein